MESAIAKRKNKLPLVNVVVLLFVIQVSLER
jgi:hypothetical protein